MKRVQVASHVFEVPDAHIADGAVPGVATTGEEALHVILNPEDPLPEHRLLLGEPASRICDFRRPPVSDEVPRACAAQKAGRRMPTSAPLKKVVRADDPSLWDYRNQAGEIIVACRESRVGGSCSVVRPWGDLIYTMNLLDADVPRLAEIEAEAESRLAEWSGGRA